MKAAGGEYTGNASDGRDITISAGFGTPDLVITKRVTGIIGTFVPSIRTSTMSGDNAKSLGESAALAANYIQAFGTDTFQVGTDDRSNRSAATYNYMAFRDDGNGGFAVFSYTGNGGGARTITPGGNFNFIPALVIVIPANAWAMEWTTDKHTAGESEGFQAGTWNQGITGFSDGKITVHSNLNTNAVVYHCAAWRTGAVHTLSYTGDGTGSRDIPHGAGYTPIGTWVQRAQGGSYKSAWRVQSTTQGGALYDGIASVGVIGGLDGTNIQVGADANTNANTGAFVAAMFPTTVTLVGGGPGGSGSAPGRSRGNPSPGGGGGGNGGGGGGPIGDPLRKAFYGKRRRTR